MSASFKFPLLCLDHAGCSMLPSRVAATIQEHLQAEIALGGWVAREHVAQEIKLLYARAAALFQASSREVSVHSSATAAWRLLVSALELGPGERVVLSELTYTSFWMGWRRLQERHGFELVICPTDTQGVLDLDALDVILRGGRVRFVSTPLLPTHTGVIQPIDEIGARVRQYTRALYLVDATQAAGQLPLDVRRCMCDAMLTTGRKYLMGPKGTALLYTSARMRDALALHLPDISSLHWPAPPGPPLALREDGQILEDWEGSVALRLGLSDALAHALVETTRDGARHIARLSEQARNALRALPEVELVYEQLERPPQTCCFRIVRGELDAYMLENHLRQRGILVKVLEPVLFCLQESIPAKPIVRISPHRSNTRADIERVCSAIQDAMRSA